MDAATAGALAKPITNWLLSQLAGWIKSRMATADQAAAWTQITTKIMEQTSAIAQRYKKIAPVAFPRQQVCLSDIYVPMTITATSNGRESHVVAKFPSKLFARHSRVLIVDVAGMGKSTIAKVLYEKSLEERAHLPLLIDLRRLSGAQSIEEVLADQFGVSTKQTELFSTFLTTQPLLFIFDGFDEVQDDKKLEVARRIRSFVDRALEAKFVITSRPELEFSDYTDFSTFRIQELSIDQAHSLIKKYGRAFDIEDRAKALLDELKARHSTPVESFLKNPLLASLLFRAFEFKSVVPVKRGVFYRQVFDALYEAHDLSKETGYVREKRTGLHHDDFHRAVRAMAKLFRQRKVVEVDHTEFLGMAKQICKSLCPDLAFSPEAFLHDVVHAVPLFTRDGSFVRWAHKSLLDYFLAEFLLRDYSKSKEEALSRNAFGMAARSNENFLVLVHEADPILFARAVTIPAINQLLERAEAISAALPDEVGEEIRSDAVTFFTSYDALLDREANFHGLLEKARDGEQPILKSFTPRLLYQFGEETGALLVFMHDAAVALQVPIALGVLPHHSIHSLSRRYSRGDVSFDLLDQFLPFLFEKTRDWSYFEDAFEELMGYAGSPDLKLLKLDELSRIRNQLQELVDRSIRARSDDAF